MKILLVHNSYGSDAPSGENVVFESEKAMLRAKGHQVQTFERHSDDIRKMGSLGTLIGASSVPWNPRSFAEIRRKLREFRPNLVHVHNTFPLISPAIFPAARGTARVLTLHNYRLFCAAGTPMRNAQVCTDCLDRKSVWPALKHGCYRGSRVATLPISAGIALHRYRDTWQHDVEAFIALTEFQRIEMIKAGLPPEKIFVRPNSVESSRGALPFDQRPNRIVFVGRLSTEKGLNDLIDTWKKWGRGAPELLIIGDGPLRSDLEALSKNMPNVRLLGQLSQADTRREVGASRLLVLPSRSLETFGLVVIEAFAVGTPVIASDIGPLPLLVANGEGATFRTGQPDSLLKELQKLWAHQPALKAMAERAFASWKSHYSQEQNYKLLLKIYERALAFNRKAMAYPDEKRNTKF